MTDQETPDPAARAAPPEDAEAGGPIIALLRRMERAARARDRVSVRQLLEAVGESSITSLMLAPALAVVTPLSGVPLLSSLCGLCIALLAAQALVGRRSAWLPGWIMRRQVAGPRAARAFAWLEAPLGWFERRTRRRLTWLVSGPRRALPRALCLLCGLAMPVLELVPFTSSILGAAVTLLAVALIVRDGLLAALGMLVIGGAVGTLAWSVSAL